MQQCYLVEYNYINGITEKATAMRDDHINYRKGLGDKMLLAGPIIGADDKPCGSLIMVEAADQAEAEALAKGDPFVGAEIFEVVSVRLMRISKHNFK